MSYSGYNPNPTHTSSGQTTIPSATKHPDSNPPPPLHLPYRPISTTTCNYNYTSQQQTYNTGYGSQYGYPPQPQPQTVSFPPGTHPEVIRSFQAVDLDRSGFIDAKELQQALTIAYHKFSLRTIKLLMFQFRNPSPKEFAELWSCLGQWRAIFERFDRDRSGKIDLAELRDALYSLGYAIPPSVLQLLISKYDDQSGRRVDLSFDSFVECGMIVKGLTEKFKEKDTSSENSNSKVFEEGEMSANSAPHVNSSAVSKSKEGGSILEILEEMITVGQTMGFSMEGCVKDMEKIIGTQEN
ncbi:probable calcium-binding protein CML48 [Tanacetum coccineum]